LRYPIDTLPKGNLARYAISAEMQSGARIGALRARENGTGRPFRAGRYF
jgi:hypothetical protein